MKTNFDILNYHMAFVKPDFKILLDLYRMHSDTWKKL